jgi:hypothetical protein
MCPPANAGSSHRHANALSARVLEIRSRCLEIASQLARPVHHAYPTQLRPAGAGRMSGNETWRCTMIFAIGLLPLLLMVLKGRAGW